MSLRRPSIAPWAPGLGLLLAASPLPAAPAADLVLRGGAVYTVDAARSWAQAVAIKRGRIAFVGTESGAAAWIGPRTRVLDLAGKMVLPGFHDAHIHPVTSGVEMGQCDLHAPTTAGAILEKVRSCAAEGPADGWLVGGGWGLPAFPAEGPKRQDLDAIVPDRPAFFASGDGHSAWVNSKALERAGLDAASPDPQSGRIEREPGTGAPSGTLREAAVDLVARLLPKPGLEERLAGLRRALDHLNRLGVTAVQEADARREELETYREAERRGRLSVRLVAALHTDPARGPEQVQDLVGLRREFTSALVRPMAAKIFEDGVIEARTAALLEPYQDRPEERGQPMLPEERLRPLVERLAREGFGVHVHAIGDRAVRLALDAIESARRLEDRRTPRHQIAHLELIHPDDLPRFRALGVVANFQPLWAYVDRYVTELTWPVLGLERSRRLYPIGSVARAGGVVAFGSDWSVSSANPLDGIQVAVTRQSPEGAAGEPLAPEEALDLPTALAAYTIGSAHACGLANETGSIEVGKSADLVVLSANLFALPARELAGARVLLTLLEGRPVFRDPSLSW